MTLIMTTLMNVNRKEQAIFEHANQILSHVTSDFSLLPLQDVPFFLHGKAQQQFFPVSPLESLLRVLSMLCVGFLEEMIFRGFLFNAMVKDGVKSAIIVSSVTFGIGHIVNLINGSGAELLPNILQVIYAVAIGFAFVMIYYKTKSLLPCIVTHCLVNATNTFANEATATSQSIIIKCAIITIIAGGYALYITLMVKDQETK